MDKLIPMLSVPDAVARFNARTVGVDLARGDSQSVLCGRDGHIVMIDGVDHTDIFNKGYGELLSDNHLKLITLVGVLR